MHLKHQPAGAKQRAQDAERTQGVALEMKLTDLQIGSTARVVSVVPADAATPPELGRRLAELGFLPGEAVRVVARGLLSREPLAVRVGTGTFALRLFEAACIRVCPELTPAG
ncbi:MAG TPA: FeoA family protein [Steroidobacteraceae bacterium]|jgi:ferrous iron transport protein A|nr:FeoA family protein [Steroidobacteraceae bacterium]